jgi:ribosomal protein L37E
MRKPIWRDVLNKRTGIVGHFALAEISYCETCEEIKRFLYCAETPDEISHWECRECRNESEELNETDEEIDISCPECGEHFLNSVDEECPKCGYGKKQEDKTDYLPRPEHPAPHWEKNKMETKKLSELASEMKLCFDRWDRSAEAGFQPVAIQDLDFWIKEIQEVIRRSN